MSGRPAAGPAPRRTAPASGAPTNAGALQLGPCQRMRPRCLRWSFRQWVLKTGSAAGRILMYSYHIVAELRQFRGVPAATDPRIHSDMPEGGNGFRLRRLDRHAQVLSRNDGVGRTAADRGGGPAG